MFTALLPALFLGASSLAGGPASAELSFATADLTTPAGAQSVYERIADTAQRVCAEENRHSAMSATATRLCVRDTIERTLDQIAAPQLNEIHASRSISPDGRDSMVLAANRD
ncbi:UrcA family protein [Hyphobacterium sp.]|jgi:UrcA family protein|uniref:UrcA family protein n=1 Tax=Hyphobacterium sp. TaxID=2004662 RepID=UPI003BAC0737